MTDERKSLTDLFAACWKDDALKARLMNAPRDVLAERGISIPDGVTVNVVENTDNALNLVIPRTPADAPSLSDAELSNAAAGCQDTSMDSYSCHPTC